MFAVASTLWRGSLDNKTLDIVIYTMSVKENGWERPETRSSHSVITQGNRYNDKTSSIHRLHRVITLLLQDIPKILQSSIVEHAFIQWPKDGTNEMKFWRAHLQAETVQYNTRDLWHSSLLHLNIITFYARQKYWRSSIDHTKGFNTDDNEIYVQSTNKTQDLTGSETVNILAGVAPKQPKQKSCALPCSNNWHFNGWHYETNKKQINEWRARGWHKGFR